MTTTHAPAPTTTDQPRTTQCGDRVELARYETDTGARVLTGQRIDGIVHVFDEPNDTGTTYTIEAGLESKAALDALITDYLAKAKKTGWPPMHGWF